MDISDYEIVYVVFPPCWGGNHFTNMLSTSDKVDNRIPDLTDNEYLKKLFDFYSSKDNHHAHVNEHIQNVGYFGYEELEQKIKTKTEYFGMSPKTKPKKTKKVLIIG